MKKYYITTPIYYVNDKPHIGHAYTTLACDVSARFKRLDGYDVFFLTGTDEHGQKVEKSAKKMNLDPQHFTDVVSQNFRDLLKKMHFSNDRFIRTSEQCHKVACNALWQKLMDRGHIYLDTYCGWYSIVDESYYTPEEVTERNGIKIAPTGAEVEWVEEPSYFFSLSKWQDKLLRLYEKYPDFIAPRSRLNEMKSFVKNGLRDLSISRTAFSWGVPVDSDQKHIMYVWLDALTNYLTAVGYPDDQGKTFQQYWSPDLHMVGKDILRFHAVYWPAFLMAAELPLPKRIFAHGWWTNCGQKISKSLGNTIDPVQLTEQYGLDQVRYFLLREVSFGKDGDFSESAMVKRINADLANDVGNFCQRSLSMIHKNCESILPEAHLTEVDRELIESIPKILHVLRYCIDKQAYNKALEEIWHIIAHANRYIDIQAPWSLRKTDVKRMNSVLYTCAETIRRLAILLQPFMPESACKMLDSVSVSKNRRNFEQLEDSLQPGSVFPKPSPIFPRHIYEKGQ